MVPGGGALHTHRFGLLLPTKSVEEDSAWIAPGTNQDCVTIFAHKPGLGWRWHAKRKGIKPWYFAILWNRILTRGIRISGFKSKFGWVDLWKGTERQPSPKKRVSSQQRWRHCCVCGKNSNLRVLNQWSQAFSVVNSSRWLHVSGQNSKGKVIAPASCFGAQLETWWIKNNGETWILC